MMKLLEEKEQNQILTLADFCTEYLQGNQGYILKGQQLHKYYSILSNLIEFSNTKLIIVNYPNIEIELINKNITINTIGYKFNAEVLEILNTNKFIYLYSIDGGYKHFDSLAEKSVRDIQLRFYATNELPRVRYNFTLKTDETINSIQSKLSGLTEEELLELNDYIKSIKEDSIRSDKLPARYSLASSFFKGK